METFKAYIVIVGFIGALGFGGYWAMTSLKDPAQIANGEDIRVVAQTPVTSLSDSDTENTPVETPVSTPTAPAENPPTSTGTSSSSVHGALISELQKLSTDKVYMKEGSRGTRVGTVQKFLNVFNNTTGGIDNDYGAGTKAKVLAFQKAVKIGADGQTGPDTYNAMVEWLQNQ